MGLTLLLLFPLQTRPGFGLGGVSLTAYTGTNVNLDGVIGAGEWSDARHLSFPWAYSNSSLTGGGEVWVKNNGTNLLIAVSANGKAEKGLGSDYYYYHLHLLFDNNNNGVINNLEDNKDQSIWFFSSTTYQAYGDFYYDSGQGRYASDAYINGTGAAYFSNPGGPGQFGWEFSIPMTSSLPDDFNLPVDASIGFEMIYSEHHFVGLNSVSSGWAYWEVSYSNGLPTGSSPSADGWASIVRTNTPGPISDYTPPTIGTPITQPASPGSSDTVKVLVNVTDTGSLVKNVTITYTTDGWKTTNQTVLASYNSTSYLATALMPALPSGGTVEYYIVAFDNVGNRALNNNAGAYFSYTVSAPWYLNWLNYTILALVLATVAAFAALLSRGRKKKTATTQS